MMLDDVMLLLRCMRCSSVHPRSMVHHGQKQPRVNTHPKTYVPNTFILLMYVINLPTIILHRWPAMATTPSEWIEQQL